MGEDGQNAGWAPPTMDLNQRTAEGGCCTFSLCAFASLREIEKHQEEQ
jgi:hypothetical protein